MLSNRHSLTMFYLNKNFKELGKHYKIFDQTFIDHRVVP